MQAKHLNVFVSMASMLLLFSCNRHETINYFVEYRVNDTAMGSVLDASKETPEGYVSTTHNKYQTVNWGKDAAGIVAVPKDGYVFEKWEKYTIAVTVNDFVMTAVETDGVTNPARREKAVYDNLILIAYFAEAIA